MAKMSAEIDEAALLGDLRTFIQSAHPPADQRIAMVAYSTQTLLCWHMGRRLDSEHLQGGRAAYGKRILVTVSRELTSDYGREFGYAEIACMIQFAQAFPEEAIVVTLSQQLSWSHFHALLPIKDPLVRDFYAEMCRIERLGRSDAEAENRQHAVPAHRAVEAAEGRDLGRDWQAARRPSQTGCSRSGFAGEWQRSPIPDVRWLHSRETGVPQDLPDEDEQTATWSRFIRVSWPATASAGEPRRRWSIGARRAGDWMQAHRADALTL